MKTSSNFPLRLNAEMKRKIVTDILFEIYLQVKHEDNPDYWVNLLEHSYLKNYALSVLSKKKSKHKTEMIKIIKNKIL